MLAFENFKVVDAKTGEDLSRSILLQIILERRNRRRAAVHHDELLAQVIPLLRPRHAGLAWQVPREQHQGLHRFQSKMQEQSRTLYGGENSQMQNDMWTQFLNFQGPAMQHMMSAYMDQSKKMVQQMQEQLQSQTRNMFTGFQFPPLRPTARSRKVATNSRFLQSSNP